MSIISYVNRFQANNNNSGPVSASCSVSGLKNGDLLLAWVSSAYDLSHTPTVPGSFTQIGSWINSTSINYWFGMFYTYYNSVTNPGPYAIGNCGYPEIIMRAYSGVVQSSPIDKYNSGQNGNSSQITLGCTVPALSATAVANEWYVVAFAIGGEAAPNTLNSNPTDCSNVFTGKQQWTRWDGDKNMGSAGSTPGAESVNYSVTNGLLGFGATLIPAAIGMPLGLLRNRRNRIQVPRNFNLPRPPIKWNI